MGHRDIYHKLNILFTENMVILHEIVQKHVITIIFAQESKQK